MIHGTSWNLWLELDRSAGYEPIATGRPGEPSTIAEAEQDVNVGSLLLRAGDPSYDLIVIESGAVDVVRSDTSEVEEAIVDSPGAGQSSGS